VYHEATNVALCVLGSEFRFVLLYIGMSICIYNNQYFIIKIWYGGDRNIQN
jgi:hypothetical protein